jgi:hypothetical protein
MSSSFVTLYNTVFAAAAHKSHFDALWDAWVPSGTAPVSHPNRPSSIRVDDIRRRALAFRPNSPHHSCWLKSRYEGADGAKIVAARRCVCSCDESSPMFMAHCKRAGHLSCSWQQQHAIRADTAT